MAIHNSAPAHLSGFVSHDLWVTTTTVTWLPECGPWGRFIPPDFYSHAHSLLIGWWATTYIWNLPSPSMWISHSHFCASTMFYGDSLHGHFTILAGLCILLSPLGLKDRGPYELLSVSPLPGMQLTLNKYILNKCKRKSDQNTRKLGILFREPKQRERKSNPKTLWS